MILESPIVTPRLLLRALRTDDASGPYARWMCDAEVLRFLEVRHSPPPDVAALQRFIAAANDDPATVLLGICLRADGRHIGNIKLGPVDRDNLRGDLGFLIGEESLRGRGLASEAIAAMATHALGPLGLAKVTAGCHRANVGSARALEKAGFVREATLRAHWRLAGVAEDGFLYARFAPEPR